MSASFPYDATFLDHERNAFKVASHPVSWDAFDMLKDLAIAWTNVYRRCQAGEADRGFWVTSRAERLRAARTKATEILR